MMTHDIETIQVAVRIRPLVKSEIARGCQACLKCIDKENQIQINGSDRGFTYNYVFNEHCTQEQFYTCAVKEMVNKLFNGYNVTILAYGQTGSGKTHSMGTCYDGTGEKGVIPRAVADMFAHMQDSSQYKHRVTVSYMELYQENLYDLLSSRERERSVVDIREDTKGIKIPCLTEIPVSSAEDTIKCLIEGSAGRATGATAMNAQSSRSHAIFTINIFMQKGDDVNTATTSKFHLVDLAGSERSKKTQATGERFREGVNINKGLLALGNVISALGDETQRSYISYRDSKLTRLLQDSLGGNSITLMIACVSPADYNLDESISTLRYADRARKIKNKPIVNQDPKAAEIARLNQIIQQLRMDIRSDPVTNANCSEMDRLKEDISKLHNKNRELNTALSSALAENTCMFERVMITQAANERLQTKLLELKETYNVTLSNLTMTLDKVDCSAEVKEQLQKLGAMKDMIADLHTEHKNNEAELQQHEYQTFPNLNREASGDHDLHDSEVDERQECFTKEQLNMNMELQDLNRVLALKEQLATQILQNNDHMIDYTEYQEDQAKITALEKEKDELLQQLKSVQANTASSKLAEQRRKRVKHLETQISDLNKKVVEQARLIKMREKDEAKIKQLNNEIQIMKSNKVKLIKTMRTEEQRFRAWKTECERNLMKLKDQDRKRQNQIVRMENMHQKQQNVMKRKFEQATATAKRLMDAMALQKRAQENRGQNVGKTERIQTWVERELELLVSTIDAERTLKQLLEDRAVLNQQLHVIQSDSDRANTTHGAKSISQITEDLDLRSAQIRDLQQKLLDWDEENKSRNRWEAVQTMVEAKCALKKLFDLTGDIRRKYLNKEYKLDELQNSYDELQEKLTQYEHRLKDTSVKYEHQLSVMDKEYQEKVAVLLKQLRGIQAMSGDEQLKERLRIQEEALEKMEEQRRERELLQEEVELLREKINEINRFAKEKEMKPEKKKPKTLDVTFVKKSPPNDDPELESSIEEVVVDDDDVNDPDWKKTPLYKRIAGLKPPKGQENKENIVKRKSDGAAICKCKGNCSTKQCGCKKMNIACSENCKCKENTCQNKEVKLRSHKLFDSDSDNSLKRHSPFEEINEDAEMRPSKPKKPFFGELC